MSIPTCRGIRRVQLSTVRTAAVRASRQCRDRRRCRARWPVLRDPSPRGLVLRHAGRARRLVGLQQRAADDRLARARVRWPHPPHPGVARLSAPPEQPPRIPGETGRARRGDLGRAAPPCPTALQPGRLHLLGAGRNDEPPHQPLLVRARSARGDVVQRNGRHGVVGNGVSLRPDLLERGRSARPGFGPPDPARPGPPPAAGGRGPRHGRGSHPDSGPIAQTRPGPCRPDRGGVAPRLALADRGRPQRRLDGRAPDGRTGRGQTVRHGARGDPVCACGGGQVPRAARRSVPRVGLGRERGLHPAPHRAHRRGGADRAGHHGSGLAHLGHGMGLDPHDLHSRRLLHRRDAHQHRGARRSPS